jgi:hypothetical protein
MLKEVSLVTVLDSHCKCCPLSYLPVYVLILVPFLRWLGQNSKTAKNKRLLANVQNKLRTKATVDLSEIRQHYVPALTTNLFADIAEVTRGGGDLRYLVLI